MSSQLLGTGGTYYVMSQLALRGFHASCTFGNAPYIDVLVSSSDGSVSLAIQVKTALHATRTRGRGENRVPYELQWPIGYKAATTSRSYLFFAFVDLFGLGPQTIPDVYIVPSAFVRDYCAPWVNEVKWVRLHIAHERFQQFRNNWEILSSTLEKAQQGDAANSGSCHASC